MPPLYSKYQTWKPGPVRMSELYTQCVSRRHDTAVKTGISKLTVQPVKRQLCWVNLCEGGDLDRHTSLFYSSFGIGEGLQGFISDSGNVVVMFFKQKNLAAHLVLLFSSAG